MRKILTALILFFNNEAFGHVIGNNSVGTGNGKTKVSLDNAGTPELGKLQLKASIKAFNPTSNDSLKLELGTSNKPERSKSIAIDYLKKLNSNGTSANLLWSYAKNNPYEIPESRSNVDSTLKGKLGQYIAINNDSNIKLELAAQQRYIKNYKKDLKTSWYRYIMCSFGAKIKIVDSLSIENKLKLYYNLSLSRVSYTKQDCDKHFNYFTLNWDREQPRFSDLSLFLKASYQYTNKSVPPEHRYAVGTEHTSRGYIPGIVSGNQGVTGILELRHKKEFKNEKIKKFLEEGMVFIFYDITHFIKSNKHPINSKHHNAMYFNKPTLPAAGTGLKLSFVRGFKAEATAEYPLQKHIAINREQKRNRPIYKFLIKKEFNW